MKRRNDYNLSSIGRHLCKFYKVSEELTFINAYHIICFPNISEVGELADGSGRFTNSSMRAHLEIAAISLISSKLNPENTLASNGVLVAEAEQLGRLAGKHTTHDEFNSASLS